MFLVHIYINFVSGEVENYKTLRLVDEKHTTRGTVFGTGTADMFDIGRAKTRAFEFNSGNVLQLILAQQQCYQTR